MDANQKFKVILLGDVDVGKTSLLIRLADGTYSDGFKGDIDQKIKVLDTSHGNLTVLLLDTAGQERFRTLTSSYFKNADVILVVYDITNKESFEAIEGHLADGDRYSKRSRKILIANKTDLENRVITTQEGEEFAKKLQVPFVETSAKTGSNVSKLVELLTNTLIADLPAETKNEVSKKKDKDKKDCIVS